MPPSTRFKRCLDRYVPFAYRPVRAAWQAYHSRRFWNRYRRLTRAITDRHGWVIAAGPFRGMEYVREAHSSALLPKVLGTYEAEVQPIVESAIAARYELVIDIGAAEGYYAVGLARRMPGARVVAFEASPAARSRCQELMDRNQVAARVDLRAAFDAGAAKDFAGRRAFVVCDVDGYEAELFSPASAAVWQRADLLVELHDYLGVRCRDSVLAVFDSTHTAELIDSQPRPGDASPLTIGLPPADRLLAVDEMRPPQQWVFLRARAADAR